VEVEEWGDRIVFLHRISAGETDRSFGVEVARLAGLPPIVVDRARKLLPTWENGSGKAIPAPSTGAQNTPEIQLTLFESSTQKVADALRSLDLEHLSPREAINKLYEIKDLLVNPGSAKLQKSP
jgi:DNA mismatch repair protein MutS